MSTKPSDVLVDPLINNNPIALQILGICSALAVTTKMVPKEGEAAKIAISIKDQKTTGYLAFQRRFIGALIRGPEAVEGTVEAGLEVESRVA